MSRARGRRIENSKVAMIIDPHEQDIGSFSVQRLLPYASRRMVGPVIFFDHMGPATLPSGSGMDVRPHPHINLATVTYLFEGSILHRDSLGYNKVIVPGDVNWMTAGRGIVHSERTPEPERVSESRMNGIQLWIAFPEDSEEIQPSFVHHPKETIPKFDIDGSEVTLILGTLYGKQSPVKVYSNLFYAEVKMKAGSKLAVPVESREAAVYVVSGKIRIDGVDVNSTSMAIGRDGEDLTLEAQEDSHLMLIGGESIGERFIFWNFVSSSRERIEEAKNLWRLGPSNTNPRFTPIPNDKEEFIPLPENVPSPKGTIM